MGRLLSPAASALCFLGAWAELDQLTSLAPAAADCANVQQQKEQLQHEARLLFTAYLRQLVDVDGMSKHDALALIAMHTVPACSDYNQPPMGPARSALLHQLLPHLAEAVQQGCTFEHPEWLFAPLAVGGKANELKQLLAAKQQLASDHTTIKAAARLAFSSCEGCFECLIALVPYQDVQSLMDACLPRNGTYSVDGDINKFLNLLVFYRTLRKQGHGRGKQFDQWCFVRVLGSPGTSPSTGYAHNGGSMDGVCMSVWRDLEEAGMTHIWQPFDVLCMMLGPTCGAEAVRAARMGDKEALQSAFDSYLRLPKKDDAAPHLALALSLALACEAVGSQQKPA